MVDFDEVTLARLAREIAMNIRNYKAVFEDFGITEDDYYDIQKNDFFQRAKEQFVIEWNATSSTVDRTRIGSAAYLEQVLPVMTKRILDPKESLDNLIEGAKVLYKTAGLEGNKFEKGQNERFVIQINLGADDDGKPVIEHYDKPIAPEVHETPVLPEVVKRKRGRPPKIRITEETDNGKTDSEGPAGPVIE